MLVNENSEGQNQGEKKIIDDKELEKKIKSKENEIRKKCTDYENSVLITEMLAEEIPKLSSEDKKIIFLGESFRIHPKKRNEKPKTPDLTFEYDSKRKGILVEIKSSLPSRHSDDFEKNMLNRLCSLKKYFQEMKDFEKHEVWLITSEHDYGSVIEFVYEKDYEELNFLRNPDYGFTLWYFTTRDKLGKDGLFINYARGEVHCPLIDKKKGFNSEKILLIGNKTYFVSDRPQAVEYTMRIIMERIIPYLKSLMEKGQYPEERFLYLTLEELMKRMREIGSLSISGKSPKKDWIRDALEKLSQINVLKKDESFGDAKYGFPLEFRSRRIGSEIYRTFAEKEIALEFDLKMKARRAELVTPTRISYIPNANAVPIVEFAEKVNYFGGLTTIETLKNSLRKENIHHEKKCSEALGFTESPFINYVRITNLGREFVRSEEFTKKRIFHEQAVKTVKLYRIIHDNLSMEKNLTSDKIEQLIQEERKKDCLEEYSESSISENRRTLMNWMIYTGNVIKRRKGRYALIIPSPISTQKESKEDKTEQESLNGYLKEK